MNLTNFGVWIGNSLDEAEYGEAASVAERLGFGAIWLGGSPRLPQIRPMLAATERITVATGIVNIWQYDPEPLAQEYAALEEEFPGRVLLGLGIGHPEATKEYQTPLVKTREFLDGIAAAPTPVPRDRMVLAALGPKMLDVSFERTLGTHPYFTSVEHTRFARERLGSGALVAPELAVVLGEEPETARETAREYGSRYLRLTNYTTNLRRFGFTDQDLSESGSDRLIDAVIPSGSASLAAEVARAHVAAGADHVCVQTVGVDGVPAAEWAAVAAAIGL